MNLMRALTPTPIAFVATGIQLPPQLESYNNQHLAPITPVRHAERRQYDGCRLRRAHNSLFSQSSQTCVEDAVLSATLAVPLAQLYDPLEDHHGALLERFHREINNRNFAVHVTSCVNSVGAVCFTLQYLTQSVALSPLGLTVAHITEGVTLRHQNCHGYTLESSCYPSGVPFSFRFVDTRSAHAVLRRIVSSAQWFESYAVLPSTRCCDHGTVNYVWSSVTNRRRAESLSSSRTMPPSTDENLYDAEDASGVDDENSDNEKSDMPHRGYKKYYSKLKNMKSAEIRKVADRAWPEWAANRYWMLTPNGTRVEVPACEDAVGVLQALCVAEIGKRPKSYIKCLPRDPFVVGLVECMGLLPPRRLTRAHRPAATSPDTWTSTAASLPPVSAFCMAWLGDSAHYSKEMDVLCQNLPNLEFQSIKDVYYVIWALRRSRHWTPHLLHLENMAVKYFRLAFHQKGRSLRRAADCAQGLVYLGHEPKALLHEIAVHLLSSWDWRAACSMGWALGISNSALLDAESSSLIGFLDGLRCNADTAEEGTKRARVDMALLWQFYLALEQAQPEISAQWSALAEVQQLLHLAKTAWDRKATRVIQTSAFQKDVYEIIRSMGYDAELESVIFGLSVDISSPRDRLVVEVDGPHHFARNRKDIALGNVLWKRRLLEGRGFTVVNVNSASWDETPSTRKAKRMFLEGAIKEAMERRQSKKD